MFFIFFEKEILSGHEFLHFDTVADAHATSKHTRVVLSFKKSNCSTHVSYNSPDFHVSIVFCFNGHFALLVPDFREARNLSELWTLNLYKFLIFCRNNLVKSYPPDFFFNFFFSFIYSLNSMQNTLYHVLWLSPIPLCLIEMPIFCLKSGYFWNRVVKILIFFMLSGSVGDWCMDLWMG